MTRSEQELGQRAGTLEDVLIGGTFFGAPAAYGISKRLTSEPELEKELIEEIGEERANRLLIGIFYDKLGMQVDPKEMSSMAKEMTPQDREEIKLRIAELRDAPMATDQELREQPMSTDQMNVYLMNKVDEIRTRMSGNGATNNVINAMRGSNYGQR